MDPALHNRLVSDTWLQGFKNNKQPDSDTCISLVSLHNQPEPKKEKKR